ncbi:MAG: hypothetical protein HY951_15155 [Bacteroidia bacterium]|nr:hypothetical protein [Bacteroidia bacterium]
MKKILFVVFALITYSFGFSQNSDVEFKFVKTNPENKTKTAIFTILGVKDAIQSELISTKIKNIPGVVSFKIFYNRRCELTTKNELKINADLIRKTLLQENVDYDVSYVTVNNKLTHATLMEWKDSYPIIGYTPKPVPGNEWVYPSSYPVITSDKRSKTEEANLLKEKQNWIETHPEEYKKMTGLEYLDYSIKLNK